MEEESSLLRNAARQHLIGFFPSLTAVGFWMLSWWRTQVYLMRSEWTLSSLDGETVSLSDYEGQTVVRLLGDVVWSLQVQSFRQFVNEHPDIPVLGIAVDGSVKTRQFAKQNRMNYPVLKGIVRSSKITV